MASRWFAASLLSFLFLSACRKGATSSAKTNNAQPPRTSLKFVDITSKAGLNFEVRPIGNRPLNILQTAGHGGALFDYDNDGWLDVLLIAPRRIALFRNNHNETFSDVSTLLSLADVSRSESSRDPQSTWMGCAVGDYNNDGWQDVFISGYRCTAFLVNDRGKLTDVGRAFLPEKVFRSWTTSAAFFDYDRDGWLDLYVGAYVKFGPNELQLCDFEGVKAACPPTYYEPERGFLLRNVPPSPQPSPPTESETTTRRSLRTASGRGSTFSDVTKQTGLNNTNGKTLGVAAADYDGDGRCDLYLANDGVPGDLFHNEGNRFVNVGLESGTSLNSSAKEQAGMGVDWGDYNGDGVVDLIVTTFQFEPTSLYRNVGRGRFMEEGGAIGIAHATIDTLGFGTKFFDADNDGDNDLIIANGHVQDNANELSPSVHYAQPVQLFENRDRRFVEVTKSIGSALTKPMVGRSAIVGDINNDGALDVLITNLEGQPRLLRNDAALIRTPLTPALSPLKGGRGDNGAGQRNWLMVRLAGKSGGGVGATISIRTGDRKQVRAATTSGSYLCASDPRVHFGLGEYQSIDELLIHWPNGNRQRRTNVPANQTLTIRDLSNLSDPSLRPLERIDAGKSGRR